MEEHTEKHAGEPADGKRPKALAVTLIILVLSMMGNILLLTQNIGFKQGRSVETGERIFAQFVEAREELGYWRQAVTELELRREDDSARLAARYLSESVERGGDELQDLMEQADRLSSEAAGDFAKAYADYAATASGVLAAIGAKSGPLDEAELVALGALDESFAGLEEAIAEFPFFAEGNRNTMIRLSGGHEWLHIAAMLLQTMRDYASQTAAGNG